MGNPVPTLLTQASRQRLELLVTTSAWPTPETAQNWLDSALRGEPRIDSADSLITPVSFSSTGNSVWSFHCSPTTPRPGT